MKSKPVYILIALAALSQGVMWVNVFSLIHDSILAYIGGVPAGMAIVGLVVYSANLLPRVQSRRARQGGWVMLVLIMIAEPVVLGVVNWWAMPAEFQSLLGSYVVAGGASLIISLVLVMGALVDRSLLPAEKPQAPKVASKGKTVARKKKQVARKSMTDENLLAYLQASPGASQQQVADHFGVTRQAVGPRVKKLYEVKQ